MDRMARDRLDTLARGDDAARPDEIRGMAGELFALRAMTDGGKGLNTAWRVALDGVSDPATRRLLETSVLTLRGRAAALQNAVADMKALTAFVRHRPACREPEEAGCTCGLRDLMRN